MNRLISGAALAAALAVASSANAADIARPVYKAPVMAPVVYNWSGFYIGGHVGWGSFRQGGTTTGDPSPGFGAPAVGGAGIAGFGMTGVGHNLDDDLFLGGVHAGFNWQAGAWVIGIEGDWTFLKRDVTSAGTTVSTWGPPRAEGILGLSASNDWLATIRGRLGYTWNTAMIYATGGAAFTSTDYTAGFNSFLVSAPPIPSSIAAGKNSNVGFVVGGGAEWMLNSNWLLRAEYLYYNFNGADVVVPITAGTCTPGACSFVAKAGDIDIHTLRVGLSYKFDYGKSPVIAKY